MQKYSFRNDYSEIAHPRILEAIVKNNVYQHAGYGMDTNSDHAKELIKERFDCKDAEIHFVSGGTQANMLVISYCLRPYEGVLCVDTGHINVHETASVEGSGHKVFTFKNENGKLTPSMIDECMKINYGEHMVKIKMVYISNSTEIGTIYSLDELKALRKKCDEYGLYLFMDGARLSSALTSSKNDIKPEDLARLLDCFYIGGTKIGMMFGEAIVLVNKNLQDSFRYHIKNKGAMLAKGFVAGIQFEEAFKDDLYFEMGKYENNLALFVQEELKKAGVEFYCDSPSNQIFPIFSNEMCEKILKLYDFEEWVNMENKKAIRFVFSWATPKEKCVELVDDIKKILQNN